MKRSRRAARSALGLSAALLVFGVALVFALTDKRRTQPAQPQRQTTQTSDASRADEEIFAHRSWTRVNSQRFRMQMITAVLCRMPTPLDKALEDGGPHRDKFVTVYVNNKGKDAMMSQPRPKFPVGSLIVKEKFPTAEGGSPELMTAMLKREAGYNPESGDWEYLVLNGEGTKIEARGKLAECMSCHAIVDKQDFVFRSYHPVTIPQETRPRSQ
ncbi:MAG TPA: cytochrome P460 family protein [Pyrinomonadaceae bacterium]|jgi:hypothetical protein